MQNTHFSHSLFANFCAEKICTHVQKLVHASSHKHEIDTCDGRRVRRLRKRRSRNFLPRIRPLRAFTSFLSLARHFSKRGCARCLSSVIPAGSSFTARHHARHNAARGAERFSGYGVGHGNGVAPGWLNLGFYGHYHVAAKYLTRIRARTRASQCICTHKYACILYGDVTNAKLILDCPDNLSSRCIIPIVLISSWCFVK